MKDYQAIRSFTEQLCDSLEIEDFIVQSMPDVSPTRWHLAHTAWFFETFLLKPELTAYRSPDEQYNYLFNSYYNAIGKQYPRPRRGMLSRPTVTEVFNYRHHVDREMLALLENLDEPGLIELTPVIILGLNHEQQHQELMLADIKHVFFQNPLYPAYTSVINKSELDPVDKIDWLPCSGGLVELGFEGPGFSFDNETPRHAVLLHPYELANRLVTNGEYLAFMEDRGYQQAQLWLSDGWALVQQEQRNSPLYWVKQNDRWFEFTLAGLLPLDLSAPVVHVNYYEADAYAHWAGARLPHEFEWEYAAQDLQVEGNFAATGLFHPLTGVGQKTGGLQQMFGDVWEWTRSPYGAYPGFKPATGAVGEYNGKFMANQMVLKGGSCASSRDHLRASYRNFFYPHSSWQFMGIRLAKDVDGRG